MPLRSLALATLLLSFSLSPVLTRGAQRNVVLIVADDHGCDLGCYGNPTIKTPHLDELAADGVRFSHAFCTTASCSASRSVILTGMHNHANGQYGHQHDFHKFSSWRNAASLPLYLRQAGYRTARCGKFHVAPESVYEFDEVLPGNARNGVQMANHCAKFLQQESDQPFFLYFCTSDPHRGAGVDETNPERPNRFGNETANSAAGAVEYDPAKVLVPGFLPNTPACRAELAEYYQSVSRVDQGVGRLIEHLKQAGQYDITLILYISDHGIAMPGAKTTLYEGGMLSPCIARNPYQPQRGEVSEAMISWVDLAPTILDFAGVLTQDGVVEEAIRRPLLERARQQTGQKANYAAPGTLHGRTFLPALENQELDGWDEVYASHTFHEIQMYYPMRVVRQRRYKLIWNIAHRQPFPFATDLWAAPTWQAQFQQGPAATYGAWTVDGYIHRPEFELFDLIADPHEGHNLADDPAHAAALARLQKKMRVFQRQTNDPWISKWEYE